MAGRGNSTITSVTSVTVRYVRPCGDEAEHLRRVVAELQATAILRAAGHGGREGGDVAEEEEGPFAMDGGTNMESFMMLLLARHLEKPRPNLFPPNLIQRFSISPLHRP